MQLSILRGTLALIFFFHVVEDNDANAEANDVASKRVVVLHFKEFKFILFNIYIINSLNQSF